MVFRVENVRGLAVLLGGLAFRLRQPKRRELTPERVVVYDGI
jgi:hypothetical protein